MDMRNENRLEWIEMKRRDGFTNLGTARNEDRGILEEELHSFKSVQ